MIGFEWVAVHREILEDSRVVVNEYPPGPALCALTRQGSYCGSPHSSGLRLRLGAALGAKLAARRSGHRTVEGRTPTSSGAPSACSCSAPTPLPILTVIFNNHSGKAGSSGVAVHADGVARTRGRVP